MSPLTLYIKERGVDDKHTRVVPCGKCIKCLKRRANYWTFRLQEESKQSTSACFVTYTYDTVPLSQNGLPTLVKKDFQNHMKRLRKLRKKSKIKYYMCGEYGTKTLRPHYHAIMFNLPQQMIQDPSILAQSWKHGHVYLGNCTTQSIAYVTGYVTKGKFKPLPPCEETGLIDDRLPEFSLMSKKMGLSFLTPDMVNYLTTNQISAVPREGGKLQGLPRYFKDKIFTKNELKIMAEEYKQIREMDINKLFPDRHEYYRHEREVFKDTIRKETITNTNTRTII